VGVTWAARRATGEDDRLWDGGAPGGRVRVLMVGTAKRSREVSEEHMASKLLTVSPLSPEGNLPMLVTPGLAKTKGADEPPGGEAARFLGMPVRVLRDALTAHARGVGGVVEARWNGIVARRIGRRWKVWLGEAWTAPEKAGREARTAGTVRPAESTGHGGKESPHGRA
jgi:hypothetical protein